QALAQLTAIQDFTPPEDCIEQDYVVTDTLITQLSMDNLQHQIWAESREEKLAETSIRVLWRYRSVIQQLQPFSGFKRFRLQLTDEERKALAVMFVELSKDEFTVYRTKGYMTDAGNGIIKDIPPDVQNKFNCIW